MNKLDIYTIDFTCIPWDRLVHWKGRAIDIPGILGIIEHGSVHEQRMALVALADMLEQKGGVIISTPLLVAFLLKRLKGEDVNQDLILRILLKVAKAIGFQWEVFLGSNEFEGLTFSEKIWETDSVYLWPSFISEEVDELNWGAINPTLFFDHAWFYTRELLIMQRDVILAVKSRDGIEQGIIYELETIINMVKDQVRKVYDLEQFSYQTDKIKLVPISDEYLNDIYVNLNKEVSEYLSFDPVSNIAFTKEYIRRSRIEFERGAGMVMVVLDSVTDEFLGSCGIHDINDETVELGLWLKKEKHGQGLGSLLVKSLLAIVKNEITTKSIIYSVEEGNIVSEYISKKLGFDYVNDFIIEPTLLKNKLRYMRQYRLNI